MLTESKRTAQAKECAEKLKAQQVEAICQTITYREVWAYQSHHPVSSLSHRDAKPSSSGRTEPALQQKTNLMDCRKAMAHQPPEYRRKLVESLELARNRETNAHTQNGNGKAPIVEGQGDQAPQTGDGQLKPVDGKDSPSLMENLRESWSQPSATFSHIREHFRLPELLSRPGMFRGPTRGGPVIRFSPFGR